MKEKTFVKGEITTANQTLEGCKESYTTTIEGSKKHIISAARNYYPSDIDVSWLSAASQTYDISPNINDYLIVDVAAVTADIPNRNFQGFLFSELSAFSYTYGQMIYQTFVGKPSCKDHANTVDENTDLAKGVIFSAVLQYIPQFDTYKIRLLQGFDRTKDSVLAHQIHTGQRSHYSMGSLVSDFVCSISGEIEGAPNSVKAPNGSVINGHLKWSMCFGCVFIENSSVDVPADPTASGVVF